MTNKSTTAIEDLRESAADLYWLAFFLTGRQDVSIELAADTAVQQAYANQFVADLMRAQSRRILIGRALAAIHDELVESACRTKLMEIECVPLRKSCLLDPDEAELRRALLAIDVFPRAALLLLIFEGVRIADAVDLLNAGPDLIRKAEAIGMRELANSLAANVP
jgi:hypothetical protein